MVKVAIDDGTDQLITKWGRLMPKEWSKQKDLLKLYPDMLDVSELKNTLDSITPHTKTNQAFYVARTRALIAMYYLTACRVSEITKVKRLRKQRKKFTFMFTKEGMKYRQYELDDEGRPIIEKYLEKSTYLGVRKMDINFEIVDGHKCMLIRTENRKNKNKQTKRQPIPYEKEEILVNYILDYIKMLGESDYLFKFSPNRAYYLISNNTGLTPHFIRHCRLTHLVTKYDFNTQSLVKFAGWTDARPAKHYIELTSKDVFREFYKGEKYNGKE